MSDIFTMTRVLTSEMLIDADIPQDLREKFWMEHGGDLEIGLHTRCFLNTKEDMTTANIRMRWRVLTLVRGEEVKEMYQDRIEQLQSFRDAAHRAAEKVYRHTMTYDNGDADKSPWKVRSRAVNLADQQFADARRREWNMAFIGMHPYE